MIVISERRFEVKFKKILRIVHVGVIKVEIVWLEPFIMASMPYLSFYLVQYDCRTKNHC